jgi:hypothetical protein
MNQLEDGAVYHVSCGEPFKLAPPPAPAPGRFLKAQTFPHRAASTPRRGGAPKNRLPQRSPRAAASFHAGGGRPGHQPADLHSRAVRGRQVAQAAQAEPPEAAVRPQRGPGPASRRAAAQLDVAADDAAQEAAAEQAALRRRLAEAETAAATQTVAAAAAERRAAASEAELAAGSTARAEVVPQQGPAPRATHTHTKARA